MAGTGQEPSPPSDANKEKGRKKTPKNRRYMKELPPEDYEMNTVSTVNPYIFVDEVEQEKRFLAYQERVKEAQERRRQRNKTIKKQERQFIQTVNERSSAPWFQDLSSRQMELTDELKNTLKSDVECKMSDLTQAYLRDLGVTPAVGAKTVRRAIKESSGDPVTFLIIVQKALAEREQREFTEDFERYKLALLPAWSFSVNERLLLSAAFHIHFPVLTRKLIRILPPPPEPLKVKWAEKQKSEKPTYSSPYLEPLPINEMCWYEERAYQDLKAKVKRQIKKQKDREKYLKSLRPRKTQEQNQGQTEKDNETDDWERLLDQEDDDHRPAAKKKKVFKTPS